MYISIFLDIEDCITPLSDDIARDLADILARHGIVANAVVVGDKMRTLERRGRFDVIQALKQHEVGLHSDRHSRHPTVAEYLEDKGWEDGIDEAERREKPGVETTKRIFGLPPSCWGVPGGSWGPQIHPAMTRLGIPIVVYPETHTAAADVHWYGGTLTFGYRHFVEGFDFLYSDDPAFEKRFRMFQTTVEENLAEGLPWMGLFAAHPITVRALEFGDVINFGGGKETRPEDWRQPPIKSEAEYGDALKNFGRLVQFVADHPRLNVVPVGKLRETFGKTTRRIDRHGLYDYARSARESDDIETGDPRLSPAEAIDILARALPTLDHEGIPEAFDIRHVDGPTTLPSEAGRPGEISRDDLSSICHAVTSFIDRHRRLPSCLKVNGIDLGPGTIYSALCETFTASIDGNKAAGIQRRPCPQIPRIADEIASRVEADYRGWVIHKPDLDTSKLLELTRLQTWTLKPAAG